MRAYTRAGDDRLLSALRRETTIHLRFGETETGVGTRNREIRGVTDTARNRRERASRALMPLTSGRPLKFKCVGATCIGETGHVREESLPPGCIPFHGLDLERPLRVDGCVSLKGQKNTSRAVSVTERTRALRERRLSKKRILNKNDGGTARARAGAHGRASPFLPRSETARALRERTVFV